MSGFSGIGGKEVQRKGGPRFIVNWRARFFTDDKVIHPAQVNSVFKTGFCLHVQQAVSIGTTVHVEFIVNFRNQAERIRVKATVDYCLVRSDGADIDILTAGISPAHNHLLSNILQEISEAKEFNLRH